jgi:XTP/dITP diphosphohydrolase
MTTILIGSHNPGKIEMMKSVLAIKAPNIRVISAAEMKLDEVIESGHTFEEIAILKASTYGIATGLPCISDDSGFCMKALDGQPGIYSARWAINDQGERDFTVAWKRIHDQLIKINSQDYGAWFAYSIVFFDPQSNRTLIQNETLRGEFVYPAVMKNGSSISFGYDAVFKPLGHDKTVGEMSFEEKMVISARTKAVSKIIDTLYPKDHP